MAHTDYYIPYSQRSPEEKAREAARQKRYEEELRAKLNGGLDCKGCGPGLLKPAVYCGFCEVELGLAPAR